MSPEIYAQAIYSLQSEGKTAEEIVKGMKDSLTKRGALNLMPQILSAYERLVAQGQNSRARLVVARDADIENAIKASDAKKDVTTITIDERIIGGYRYEANGTLQDQSFKAKLLQIYRNATHA